MNIFHLCTFVYCILHFYRYRIRPTESRSEVSTNRYEDMRQQEDDQQSNEPPADDQPPTYDATVAAGNCVSSFFMV